MSFSSAFEVRAASCLRGRTARSCHKSGMLNYGAFEGFGWTYMCTNFPSAPFMFSLSLLAFPFPYRHSRPSSGASSHPLHSSPYPSPFFLPLLFSFRLEPFSSSAPRCFFRCFSSHSSLFTFAPSLLILALPLLPFSLSPSPAQSRGCPTEAILRYYYREKVACG